MSVSHVDVYFTRNYSDNTKSKLKTVWGITELKSIKYYQYLIMGAINNLFDKKPEGVVGLAVVEDEPEVVSIGFRVVVENTSLVQASVEKYKMLHVIYSKS